MPDGLEDWLGLRQCVLPFAFATQHLEETQTDLIMKRHFEWALVKVNYRKEAVLSSLGCCLKGEGNWVLLQNSGRRGNPHAVRMLLSLSLSLSSMLFVIFRGRRTLPMLCVVLCYEAWSKVEKEALWDPVLKWNSALRLKWEGTQWIAFPVLTTSMTIPISYNCASLFLLHPVTHMMIM